MRKAANCLLAPSLAKKRRITPLKRKEKAQDKEEQFYYFLCDLALQKSSKKKTAKKKSKRNLSLLENYHKIKGPRIKCEALSLWYFQERANPSIFLQKEKAVCRKNFPGLAAVHREIFLEKRIEKKIKGKLKGKRKKREPKTSQKGEPPFFDANPFHVSDPGVPRVPRLPRIQYKDGKLPAKAAVELDQESE